MTILARRSAQVASALGAFPLSISPNSRYLVQANGAPFPLLGFVAWELIRLQAAAMRSHIDHVVADGFNSIEVRLPSYFQDRHASFVAPFDGDGNLPFTTKVGGGTYTGSFAETPDLTTPAAAYWANVDGIIDYCNQKGVAVQMFPAYVGYDNTEGMSGVMLGNGTTKCQTYGAWVANRYKSYGNIIWMLGGDKGTTINPWASQNEIDVEQAFIDGLLSVSGQQSTQFAAEWAEKSTGYSSTDFGGYLTLQSAYGKGTEAEWCRNGYSHSPAKPSYLLEEAYDESGPDGLNYQPAATQPTRRMLFRGILGAIAGYNYGNSYVWRYNTGYASHYTTTTATAAKNFNSWWRSLPWNRLVPDGLGGIGTLVTSGAGTVDSDSSVAAAATPEGDLLVAYGSPDFTSFVIDMTKMRGTTAASWRDPVTGALTSIGSFANSGTHTFNSPGNNSAGEGDWFLVLTA